MASPGTEISLEWNELRAAIRQRTDAVVDLLGQLDGDAPVAGSDWTVSDLAAHLVSIPRRYLRMMAVPEAFPVSLAAMNQTELEAIGTRDVDELGSILVGEMYQLLDHLGDTGTRSVPFFALTSTAEQIGAVAYGELVLHGFDLARMARAPWMISRAEAAVVLGGLLPAIGAAVDPRAAVRAAGTYHLRIRDAHDWTIEIANGVATISRGRPVRADLHVSADPRAFLLTSYGRTSQLRALLLGQIIAYGTKPWLALPFSRVFRET